jgi:uncharacterized protein (TIGR03067 family)
VAKNLPARPNLDHLRSQAKTLLARLKAGDAAAVRTFITHLPEARAMTPAAVRTAGFRLADAQSAVARKAGFSRWPLLSRHVQQLRDLEGEWGFVALQVDGTDMPAAAFGTSRLLIDGDRFRMASAEANYDGTFAIDVSADPMQIDIEFVEGPEAGNRSCGIYVLDHDRLTICLGLTGASRPAGFSTRAGSGHALERLRRLSAARPSGVTGGTPSEEAARAPESPARKAPVDSVAFDVEMTPLLQRLQGEWTAVSLVMNGEEMSRDWLPFGSRTTKGNEVTVVFGGQVMLQARMRIDEAASPMAVDYLNLAGSQKGRISLGILEWAGEDARFLMATPGQPRPPSFSVAGGKGLTLSQWRRRGI